MNFVRTIEHPVDLSLSSLLRISSRAFVHPFREGQRVWLRLSEGVENFTGGKRDIKAIFNAVASSPRYLRPSARIQNNGLLCIGFSRVEAPTKVLPLIAF